MMEDKCTCEFFEDECLLLKGNQVEFEIKKDDCEIRANIPVKEMRCVNVFGEVKNCQGKPVENALVKLVKVICKGGKEKLEGVAHTITDCKGFFQFNICTEEEEECEERKEKPKFRLIVGMAATGKERTIHVSKCEPCFEKDCDCD